MEERVQKTRLWITINLTLRPPANAEHCSQAGVSTFYPSKDKFYSFIEGMGLFLSPAKKDSPQPKAERNNDTLVR